MDEKEQIMMFLRKGIDVIETCATCTMNKGFEFYTKGRRTYLAELYLCLFRRKCQRAAMGKCPYRMELEIVKNQLKKLGIEFRSRNRHRFTFSEYCRLMNELEYAGIDTEEFEEEMKKRTDEFIKRMSGGKERTN